jgi:amidase
VDDAGMPFGLQVVGRFRGDLQLLAAAAAMEQAFAKTDELRRPRPALDKLGPVEPTLRSIVTAPPVYGASPSAGVAAAA